MGHPSNRSLCSWIFTEKVESGGTRLEVTPLEAPWRSGKTERAGRDWKEDYYKMTQDGPEAPTWTVLECGGADLGAARRQQTGELVASLALDQKR